MGEYPAGHFPYIFCLYTIHKLLRLLAVCNLSVSEKSLAHRQALRLTVVAAYGKLSKQLLLR